MNDLKALLANKKVLFTLILTFIMTVLSSIILPFLAIFTLEKSELSIANVGLIIGTRSLAASIFGLLSGRVEKKVSTKKILYLSVILVGICHVLYAYAQSLLVCLILIFLLGTAEGIQGPIMKSILATNKSNVSSDFVFRLRYMIFCVAIILGPVLSQLLYLQFDMGQLFVITGVAQLVTGVLLLFFYKESHNVAFEVERTIDQKQKLRVDKKIMLSCIVGIISFSVFSIFESVTPLAFNEYTDRVVLLFSVLVILNSIIALIIQPLIMKAMNKIHLKHVFYAGSILFSISYFIFAYSSGRLVLVILGTLVFTVGEAFLIPSIDVLVDTISNHENKTDYFSLAEFKQLGFFIGPILSGILIDYASANVMYIFFGLFSLSICFVINFISLDKTEN